MPAIDARTSSRSNGWWTPMRYRTSEPRQARALQRGELRYLSPRTIRTVRQPPTNATGHRRQRLSSCIADSASPGAQLAGREVQQRSTATPLASTGLPCLRTPRSVLRHALTTAMPRVRNEGSGVRFPSAPPISLQAKALSEQRSAKETTSAIAPGARRDGRARRQPRPAYQHQPDHRPGR
jgi:hypothetical protein